MHQSSPFAFRLFQLNAAQPLGPVRFPREKESNRSHFSARARRKLACQRPETELGQLEQLEHFELEQHWPIIVRFARPKCNSNQKRNSNQARRSHAGREAAFSPCLFLARWRQSKGLAASFAAAVCSCCSLAIVLFYLCLILFSFSLAACMTTLCRSSARQKLRVNCAADCVWVATVARLNLVYNLVNFARRKIVSLQMSVFAKRWAKSGRKSEKNKWQIFDTIHRAVAACSRTLWNLSSHRESSLSLCKRDTLPFGH